MALLFDAAADANHAISVYPAMKKSQAYPLTMTWWTYQSDVISFSPLQFLSTPVGVLHAFYSDGNYVLEDYDGSGHASSANVGYRAGWQFWGGIFYGMDARVVYAPDGQFYSTGTPPATVESTMDRVALTAWGSSAFGLAEVAAWSVDLVGPEFTAMRQGRNPSTIRPNKLLWYYPLVNDVLDYGPMRMPVTGIGTWDRQTAKFMPHPAVERKPRLHRILRGSVVAAPPTVRPRISMVA